MGYAAFKTTDAYVSKHSGAGIRIYLVDIGTKKEWRAHTNVNFEDAIEQVPIREAGEKNPTQLVQGAIEPNVSVDGIFSPEINDGELPNRENFIGKQFHVLQVISDDRPGAATVLNALIGFGPNRVSISQANAGTVSFAMSGPGLYRMTGEQYALEYGQN